MNRIIAAALLVMLTTSALAAEDKVAEKADDGIKQTAESFFNAWNEHDAKKMAALWTDDATLINPMGRKAHGKAEIEQLLTDEQTTVFRNSTAKLVDLQVTRRLGPNLVFCDGEVMVDGIQAPDGSPLPSMRVHLVQLMERKGGRWLVAEARPYAFREPRSGATTTDSE